MEKVAFKNFLSFMYNKLTIMQITPSTNSNNCKIYSGIALYLNIIETKTNIHINIHIITKPLPFFIIDLPFFSYCQNSICFCNCSSFTFKVIFNKSVKSTGDISLIIFLNLYLVFLLSFPHILSSCNKV